LDFGLWYPKGEDFTITTYTDADRVGSVDDRKNTRGGEFFLGNCLVSLLSNKLSSISLSTTKLEYIATTSRCTQILWMKQT
jgi:phosphomannomutase